MVKTGDSIIFEVDGESKQGLVTGIEQKQGESRYELLVKDIRGNCIVLIEGDDIFTVLK